MNQRFVLSFAFLGTSLVSVAQTSNSIFVPVTPCRVADTRNPTAPLGGPVMLAGTSRSFPIPTSSCGIPATANAYSLNVTVVPTGTLEYLTIWPTGQSQPTVSTLNSPTGQVVANAAVVQAGASGAVSVYVTGQTEVIIDIDGYFSLVQPDATFESTAFGTGALANDSSTHGYNTAFGYGALTVNSSGSLNTAIGNYALGANTTGTFNTAVGVNALSSNTTGINNTTVAGLTNNTSGYDNTAMGLGSLDYNTTGYFNTATGFLAMYTNTTGAYNTATGDYALYLDLTGSYNTALGESALYNATGGQNVAVGYQAGANVTTGYYNIDIGNPGTSSDGGVIRIGQQSSGIINYQTSTYIAGIYGSPVSGAAVIVNANGQLGVASSSIRYKEDVHDIGDIDDVLMRLRPVSFRYKGTAPVQYGLIAEEVDQVYPSLVARDNNGVPMTVQYHELPALLLSEIQRQHRMIEGLEAQGKQLAEQREVNQRLEKRMADLENLLMKQQSDKLLP